jgi:hypothetical protein
MVFHCYRIILKNIPEGFVYVNISIQIVNIEPGYSEIYLITFAGTSLKYDQG